MYMHAWAYWYLIRQSSTGTFIWTLVMTSHSVPSLSSPSHAAVDEPADDEDWGCSLQDLSRQEPVPWLQNAWWGSCMHDILVTVHDSIIILWFHDSNDSMIPSLSCLLHAWYIGHILGKAICTQLEEQRKDLQAARDGLQVLVDNYEDRSRHESHL